MLGLGDSSIFFVYILCILSALACVIYGIFSWNKGADKGPDITADKWQQTEAEIADKLDI